MSSPHLENSMKQLVCRYTALSAPQIDRVSNVSSALLLAESTQLSKVARWVRRESQQKSRIQFLMRVLAAPYVTQEQLYHPLVSQALSGYAAPIWHLAIDRSNLVPHVWDLLMVSLSFRKRAIPLAWKIVPFGCTGASTQTALLEEVVELIPPWQAIILHGDTEFGAVPMMSWCRYYGWDFILGQTNHTYYQVGADETWRYLKALKITRRRPVYLSPVQWTKEHAYGPLTLYAFYAPHQNGETSPRYEYRYYVTSLPIAHTLRRIGRRRWGTEPLFRDFKSAGWHIEESDLHHDFTRERLLCLLSLNYLWATCLGRWLCKTGCRTEIDNSRPRRYSLFRIGLDWLIHRYVLDKSIPPLLTLYA